MSRQKKGKRKDDGVIMNEAIRARELRVIGENKEQFGIIPREVALELAEEQGLDLVLLSPDANPPVAKIMDYGKHKYQMEKKKKEQRKGRSRSPSKQKSKRTRKV